MTTSGKFSFSQHQKAREILLDWWQHLDQARGDRAELRRAAAPTEVAFCPAFHHLLHALKPLAHLPPESLAAVAGVLVHVREHDGRSPFAVQMATPKFGSNRPSVSGHRFRRLLKIADRSELYQPLIRTVHLLGGLANITSLADDIYFWGEPVRKNWAYAYYEVAPSEE
ncbi:MAG: type I-E CRISPR-associated protein Cse2/CasB [Nitrospiraceae bacterium]